MEKLVIKKRTAEEMACWKVDANGVCPNTVVESDSGLALIFNIEGTRKMTAKSPVVVNSLLNPGKTTKLFGGKKPYSSCEIYAIDMSTEFKSEWGLAGPGAISCYDAEFEVDAKAVCFGEFFYKIDDLFAFTASLPLGEKNEISRNDVREFFRAQTAGVAGAYLASKLASRDLRECRAKLSVYSEEIKEQLNKSLESKGVTVYTFIVSNLDFEPSHKVHREKLKEAKIGVVIKGVENEGRRDDLSVDKEKSEIEIGYIKAQAGDNAPDTQNGNKVTCPRCGEVNDNSTNYCRKCGEKLNK